MKTTLIGRLKDVFDELTGKNRFGKPDFVLLKTMMMLAAMDGEIADDEVRCLTADNRPLLGRLTAQRDGITGTIRAIDFGGERVYVNPFRTDVEMTEDEIAVAAVLTRMRDHLAGGAPNTPFAFRDSYLAIAMREAAQAGACVTADALAWDAPEAAAR